MREIAADPAISLPAYGWIIDQQTGQEMRFNPTSLTTGLQQTVLSYVSNPPQTEHGQNCWLSVLKGRQSGSSTIAALAGYPLAQYTPGWDSLTIADTKERADHLHRRAQFCHKRWPDALKEKTLGNRESRQITFDHGGKVRVLSGASASVGIGQSPDYFHASELAFWGDAGHQWSMMAPAMINRDHALAVFECTPCTMDQPSAQWWHDQCVAARAGRGRNIFAFFPFWDTKLCARPWPKDSKMDSDELALWERYAKQGLRKENLAFRRLMMETDEEIRRNNDLFQVYYPFDYMSCWITTAGSAIKPYVLKRHAEAELVQWDGPYMEYEAPEPGAIYVIGVDPAGFGMRDHASFQVLKVWADEWKQVACYAGVTDPVDFGRKLLEAGRRYNNAMLGIERNGVGAAALAMVEAANYPNVLYDQAYKPGIWKKSQEQMLNPLVDALLSQLVIRDEDTVAQLQSYNNDKIVERSVRSEIMANGRSDTRRRERHHWDKVSALAMACITAEEAPRRFRPEAKVEDNLVPFKGITYDDLERIRKANQPTVKQRRGRARYRSVRRRGR